MMQETFDPLAYALGAYSLATAHFDHAVDRPSEIDERLRLAEEALVATAATDLRGVMGKIERVWEHADENRDSYGRLLGELETCQRELMEPRADLGHSAAALSVLARRFERDGAGSFYVRLLRSAATDVRGLAA